MVLGIIGGIAGLIGSTFAIFIGGVGSAFSGDTSIIKLGLIAILLSIMGIVGGVMANHKSRVSAYLMLIAGINGLIAISGGFIVAGPLLIISGILSLQNAKKEKIPANKKKMYIWLGVGLAVFAILMMVDDSSTNTENVDINGDGVVTEEENKNKCPDIAKKGDSFEFFWSQSDAGHKNLYLYADFLLEMEFSNSYSLANKPDVSAYLRDYFVCEKGSDAGQSINKLYCEPLYLYEPRIEKQNLDSDGNIISTDKKYLKEFIFDVLDKDIENVNDLNSLQLGSVTCSDSSW